MNLLGALHGYRFGQIRNWCEPGGRKTGAEEMEKRGGGFSKRLERIEKPKTIAMD